MKLANPRKQNGAVLMVMVLVTGFIILGVVGLFCYEVTRNNTAREELRSACEAAALAGAAALASSDSTDPTTTHNAALTAAQQAFKVNSIIGTSLNLAAFTDGRGSTSTSVSNPPPTSNEAKMYLQFEDTKGVNVTDWSNSAGRIVNVFGSFGEEPSFGKFIGISTAPVYSSATARVPLMDIVMCFDTSGSIDDQTPVTFVRRWWDSAKAKNPGVNTPASPGAIQYTIVSANGKPAEGTIYGIINPPATGTILNAEPPMNQNSASPLSFRTALRAGPSGSDSGEPPGNYPNGSGSSDPNFTDMVTNLDGKNVFAGVPSYTYAGQSYRFPDVATLVEASRGNLEDATVFKNSGAQASLPDKTITPQAGYKKAYEDLRHQNTQPIGDARQSAQDFFNIMNNNTNAQFSLVTFSSNTSTTPGKTFQASNIDGGYAAGGQGQFPEPGNALALATTSSVQSILNSVKITVAHDSTNMGQACQDAVDQLNSATARKNAKKAIVFFTDGQPTVGPSWNAAATAANPKGIAIYTVGLAQNKAIIQGEVDNLNDDKNKLVSYVDPITGQSAQCTPSQAGMAAVAGNGGKFYLVTNRQNLRYVFENIARQLVQLAKGS